MSKKMKLNVRSSEDRSALIAVTVFPLIILAAFCWGFFAPASAAHFSPYTNILLGVIMFGMGLTLKLADFKLVFTRPIPVFIGVIAQYLIMPAAAWAITAILDLPPAVAAGVILVGCAPGGTSSNVISYLSKADVALSVTMTSISTLLAPIMTPLLTTWLVGDRMPIDGAGMAISIVEIVLIPVVSGLVIRYLADRYCERFFTSYVLPVLPWISTFGIAGVVLGVVSGSVDVIRSAGLIVFAAVILHNLCGYGFGYLFARLFRVRKRAARTTSIEVGMQNSGLAAGLAKTFFGPEAALAGAIFSIWHNISGALLAMYYRWTESRIDDDPVIIDGRYVEVSQLAEKGEEHSKN
ncbi:bile acid:Na+ symporter, BASS family [Actinobaculum suis]|uniref:Bile acid:Na+ symporter, BASS family n=1 Tax=Actinobaculum suis TaxID=1657 RepID=A0A1G7B1S5_9ACTO|nr:bile acid:sodium symporter family protein [Actinobaculum suis]MDY5153511.1 bile acid:sodium symporter family protein [Actinobaculum suis]SDE20216.1 bile acid:Na+ symporter, BASS family [Actinobaculum suis]